MIAGFLSLLQVMPRNYNSELPSHCCVGKCRIEYSDRINVLF